MATAIGVLVTVIGVLWLRTEIWMRDCQSHRDSCEADLRAVNKEFRAVWSAHGERRHVPRIANYQGLETDRE